MMLSVSTVLEVLRNSALLPPAQMAEAARLAASSANSQQCTAQLGGPGWLTKYQAEEVNNGRGFGLVVGPYVLLDRLGQGGMGEVFRARQRSGGLEVALKRILPGRLESPDAVA